MGREWPTREQWAADAEKAVRTACYPSQRVSSKVADWADEAERAQLAHVAGNARLGMSRVASMLREGREFLELSDVDTEMSRVHTWIRQWEAIQNRATAAAEVAVEAAIATQVAYRQTDEAWAKELRRREEIDEYFAGNVFKEGAR